MRRLVRARCGGGEGWKGRGMEGRSWVARGEGYWRIGRGRRGVNGDERGEKVKGEEESVED